MTRALLIAAVLTAACSGETAILVDVSWDPGLASGADTLRLYVGTGPEGASDFTLSEEGSSARSLVEVTSPYRYVLRPDGALADIGQLGIAAALTVGEAPDRIRPIAFATSPDPVAFADGELRLVRLQLTPEPYLPGGPLGECAVWEVDAGSGSIGRPGDVDCDGTPDDVDCAPRDPGDTSTAMGVDSDGIDCGDCLDGDAPVRIGGWSIDPGTVFPGQTESAFRADNGIPSTVDCLHIDFDCDGACGDLDDRDGSGADACGSVTLGQDALSCPAHPSDCDESVPGDTPSAGEGERCDGRDSNCDGRPAPPVPCALDLGGPVSCRVGLRACDDDAGIAAEACEAESTLTFTFTEACRTLHAADACLYDDDPLGCATDLEGGAHVCKIGVPDAGGGCGAGERLVMAGDLGAVGCTWRVIGGMKHADWDVGFVPQQSAPGTPPMPSTATCAPFLVVRPVNSEPVRRTIMIVGEAGIGLGGRALFLTLDRDENCDGQFSCSPALFP